MKTDAIIIGAELDGLVAAVRLQQYGYTIRLLAGGGSSLHYAPGGVHVLGYAEDSNETYIANPLETIDRLAETHPYRKLGVRRVRDALEWFAWQADTLRLPVAMSGSNEISLSSIGLRVPVFGPAGGQATLARLAGRKVVIVRFTGHRDFTADPIRAELGRLGFDAAIAEIPPPGPIPENAALARALDGAGRAAAYFETVKDRIPGDAGVLLFPAVLGLADHADVLAAAQTVFGRPCFEAPTLPPSIPGMRLDHALQTHLKNTGVAIHTGTSVSGLVAEGDDEMHIRDDDGRRHDADAFILSTGGVLMGGLAVDSRGVVRDTVFGLETFQSHPLNALSVDQSLDALHVAGIETDTELRPAGSGRGAAPNIFVTGRSLAHWNPASECSADGVCIATGWAAAENAHRYLEGRTHG